jgi:hypothetical protein
MQSLYIVRSYVNQYQKLYQAVVSNRNMEDEIFPEIPVAILAVSVLSTNSNFALVLALFWCYPVVGTLWVPSRPPCQLAPVSAQVLF